MPQDTKVATAKRCNFSFEKYIATPAKIYTSILQQEIIKIFIAFSHVDSILTTVPSKAKSFSKYNYSAKKLLLAALESAHFSETVP